MPTLRAMLIRLLGALALVLAVLIVAAAMGTVVTSRSYRDAAELSMRRSTGANQLLIDILDAETGYRGYVLTGSDAYLEPYSESRTRYPNDLAVLRELTRSEPDLIARAEALDATAQRWFRETTTVLSLRQRDPAAAIARINQGAAKRETDEFRRQFALLRADVLRLRARDLREADRRRNLVLGVIVLVAVLALAVLAGSVRRVWRNVGDPIAQLALGVGRVARGRLSDPVGVQSGSVREMAQLIRGFNAMQLQVFQQRDAVAAAARREVAQQTERRLWETVQNGLLPERLPNTPVYRVAARYRPAETALLVGGDFYDTYLLADGRLAVMVGDVTGHGATSAAQAAGLRFGWRTMVAVDPRPHVVVAALNAQMARAELRSNGVFASIIYALIGPDGTGVYTRAGHPPPVLAGADGCRELLSEERGPLLGVVDDPSWPEVPLEIAEGETLVMFTDGLVEAGAPEREQFGVERVCDVLYAERASAAQVRLERAMDAARRHDRGRLRDDVVIVAVERIARIDEYPT
ncbi:MAG: SpoIIE family protein phosphatase [Thermoleophilia bacterium]|nr:SpoIIE family protein phosphatase [Thermoleophilia bacterium]